MHLTPKGCVAPPMCAGSHIFFLDTKGFVKPVQNAHILTCMLGTTTFESICALPLNVIYYF